MRVLPVISVLLLAAGCGASETGNSVESSPGNAAVVPSAESTAPSSNEAKPADEAQPDAPTANVIPEVFRGTWDRDAAACGSRTSEMRLVVSESSLRFYESVGTVTSVRQETGREVRVSASFEGEGERWTRDLSLAVAGDSLTVSDGEGSPTTRVRCP